MVVRDAADILSQTLEHLLTWADTIHVLDTGSVDSTWEIVADSAARDKRVVPVTRSEIYFNDGLRGVLFEIARRIARDGDWFLRTDDDEFYDVPPPTFVREHLTRSE